MWEEHEVGIFIHPLAPFGRCSILLLEGTALSLGDFPTAPFACNRVMAPLLLKPQGPSLSSVVSFNPDHKFINSPFITLSSNYSF